MADGNMTFMFFLIAYNYCNCIMSYKQTFYYFFFAEKILQKVAFPVTALGAYSVVLAVFGIIAAKRKSVILLIMVNILCTSVEHSYIHT